MSITGTPELEAAVKASLGNEEPPVQAPVEQPVVETPAEPPAEPVVETPAEPVVETPVEPVVETPVVETPAEPAEGPIDFFETPTEEPTTLDWMTVSEHIGTPVSNAEALKEAWNKREGATFANDLLKEANNVLLNGGTMQDVQDIMFEQEFDLAKITDESLVYNNYISQGLTEEQAKDEIDNIGETQVKLQGNQLRAQQQGILDDRKAKRQQMTESYKINQQKQLEQNKTAITSSLEELEDYKGYKFDKSMKNNVLQNLTTTISVNGQEKVKAFARFLNKDGSINSKELVKMEYLMQYGDKIMDFVNTKAKNNGVLETVTQMRNEDPNRPSPKQTEVEVEKIDLVRQTREGGKDLLTGKPNY